MWGLKTSLGQGNLVSNSNLFLSFHIFIIIVLLYRGTSWHLLKFFQCIIVEFTQPIILLYLSPPLITGTVSTVLIFPFSCIHPSIPFPYILTPPTGKNSQAGPILPSYFPFLEKKKESNFVCLRYLYREFHCDIFMYISIVTWIDSSLLYFSFLPSSPYYGDSTIFTFLTSFFYSPSSISDIPFA
jgi:hypothetical protein